MRFGLLVGVLLVIVGCSGAPEEPDALGNPSLEIFQISVEVSEPKSRPHLDRIYNDCLLERGFDPEGVQVLVGSSGVPYWVKTGHNVPGGLHGPCFEAIGGAATDASSWGVAIADD